jgi:hypothetical protein
MCFETVHKLKKGREENQKRRRTRKEEEEEEGKGREPWMVTDEH